MDERRPLLPHSSSSFSRVSAGSDDVHTQFCTLAGIIPSNLPKDAKWPKPSRTTIYQRAKRKEVSQNRKYIFTAVLTNTLLLSQIVIGAALTALGASNSPSIFVALFGALNTIIAGVVTYLKSRGQPMRSRMFREDLERVIDEVENSETMWLGIASKMHGFSAIDTEVKVSVRSEVARLTRLYDKAVRNNTNNNPDLYLNSSSSEDTSGLRGGTAPAPIPAPPATVPAPAPAPAPTPATVSNPDEAPAPAPAPASKASDPVSTPPKDDNPADTGDKSLAADASKAPATSPPAASVPNNTQATPQPIALPSSVTNGSALKPLTADIDEGPVTMDIPDKKPSKAEEKGT